MTEPENWYWQELHRVQQEAQRNQERVLELLSELEQLRAEIATWQKQLSLARSEVRRLHVGDL